MTMIATDLGIAAARDARVGGFLVSLKEFSITEATGFEVRADRTELVGAEVYRATILGVEAIDKNTVRLTCHIPKGRPADGQWNVGEIGVWDANGVLFAHGDLPPFPKTSEYGLKFYVYVSLARLGEVINITTSDLYSLPSAASVSTLLNPTDSMQNVVVVMDANTHEDEVLSGMPRTSSSPALAIKHGPGGTAWGFTGHARVHIGKPDVVTSLSAFNLDVAANGVWLTDGEIVIVQILSGAGAGESRKMQYNATANRFTVIDQPFSSMNQDSYVHIWRSHESSLPARNAGLPDYMVLGVGENNYSVTTSTLSATHLQPHQHAMMGNNGETYNLPGTFPLSELESAEALIVSVGDNILAPGQYSISGQVLRIIGGASSTTRISLWGFKREDTGAQLSFQEAQYKATGQLEYNTPMVADTKAKVMVIAADTVVPSDDYTLVGAKVIFTAGRQPQSGDVYVLVCGNTFSDDIRGSMARDSFPVAAGANRIEFESSADISGPRNVLVFVGGKYLPRARYRIQGRRVIMRAGLNSTVVDVLNFTAENTEVVQSRVGRDTGPQWVDPAGAMGMPNKLIPRRHTFTASGQPSFPITPVPDISHLIVAVNEKIIHNTEFVYDGMNIWPHETLTGGERVEVICFTSIDHPGTSARPKATRFVSTGQTAFNMHQSANPDSRIVMVDGEFIPTNAHSYSAANGVLNFPTQIPAGKEVYLWTYEDANELGKQVKAYSIIHPISTAKTYAMRGILDDKLDMVAATTARIISWDIFGLLNQNLFSFLEFVNTPDASLIGLDLQITHFVTRTPQTRLVLRADLDAILAGYLKSTNNLSDLTDVEAARQNLGLGEAALNARYLQRVLNLADVPDKAAARNNLGITDLLNQLASNVLFKNMNLADVPDKGAARANLGIGTAALENAGAFLRAALNLADVPDKAAARANLGIDMSMIGIDGNFTNVNAWWARIGPFHIQGGRWTTGTNMGEGSIITVPFPVNFPSACATVILSDINPDQRDNHDAVGQVLAAPSNVSFRIYVNEPGRASSNWRGAHWVAFGW